jgi:cell division protein FtsB
MRPYLRYRIQTVYTFCDREFRSVATVFAVIVLLYFAVCLVLTVIHVEARKAASRAQYEQQKKDREIIRRGK